MDYIEKLEIQTEEVTEAKPLEKNSISVSNPVTVEEYEGHTREFLAIGEDYDDGFTPLNQAEGLGINCVVYKEVKEDRQGKLKLVDNIQEIKNELVKR